MRSWMAKTPKRMRQELLVSSLAVLRHARPNLACLACLGNLALQQHRFPMQAQSAGIPPAEASEPMNRRGWPTVTPTKSSRLSSVLPRPSPLSY